MKPPRVPAANSNAIAPGEPMTDMNQSFIRAFAKKDAAVNSLKSGSAQVADSKPSRRASVLSQRAEPVTSTKLGSSKIEPAAKRNDASKSISSLLSSESVLVFSSFGDEISQDHQVASSEAASSWTTEAAEAAQSAVAQV